ncbi:MAG: hypothetical protein KGZ88_06475 [Methylomicrobium sp.]|nr:hypothetical protein [Methylomicrobium sp.]
MSILDLKNIDLDKLLYQLDTALKINIDSDLESNKDKEQIKAIMYLVHAKLILLRALNNKHLPVQDGELLASSNTIRDALENDPTVMFFKDEEFWAEHSEKFATMNSDERREFYKHKNADFH